MTDQAIDRTRPSSGPAERHRIQPRPYRHRRPPMPQPRAYSCPSTVKAEIAWPPTGLKMWGRLPSSYWWRISERKTSALRRAVEAGAPPDAALRHRALHRQPEAMMVAGGSSFEIEAPRKPPPPSADARKCRIIGPSPTTKLSAEYGPPILATILKRRASRQIDRGLHGRGRHRGEVFSGREEITFESSSASIGRAAAGRHGAARLRADGESAAGRCCRDDASRHVKEEVRLPSAGAAASAPEIAASFHRLASPPHRPAGLQELLQKIRSRMKRASPEKPQSRPRPAPSGISIKSWKIA